VCGAFACVPLVVLICVDDVDRSENVDVDAGDKASSRNFAIAAHKLLVSEECIGAEAAVMPSALCNPTWPRNLSQEKEGEAFKHFASAVHESLVSELCTSAETAALVASISNPTWSSSLRREKEALAFACRHRRVKTRETPSDLVLIALQAFPLAFTIVRAKGKSGVYANSKFSFE
jgi:hypothetical protein